MVGALLFDSWASRTALALARVFFRDPYARAGRVVEAPSVAPRHYRTQSIGCHHPARMYGGG